MGYLGMSPARRPSPPTIVYDFPAAVMPNAHTTQLLASLRNASTGPAVVPQKKSSCSVKGLQNDSLGFDNSSLLDDA